MAAMAALASGWARLSMASRQFAVLCTQQRCSRVEGKTSRSAPQKPNAPSPTASTGAATPRSRRLVGTYQLRTEVSRRLLDVLPPVLVLPGDAWDSRLIQLLAEEIVRDEPGQ